MLLKEKLYRRKSARLLCLALSGILMSLPQVFPILGFLAWVGMIPAGVVLLSAARDSEIRLRGMYGYGFLFFLAFYSVGFHWFIAMYPLSFVDGMSKPEAMIVVIVATFGLSALQASFSALYGVILALAARRGLGKRHPMLLTVTAALLFPIFEWAQTFTWAGVPWNRLACGQVEWTSMLKTVSLFGPYFLAAVVVAVNLFLAELLMADSIKRKRICLSVSALLIALCSTVGSLLCLADRNGEKEITVAAIQPNVSSKDPWGFNTTEQMMDTLEQYSLDAAMNGASLIVWPETVFPLNINDVSAIYEFSSYVADECDATVVVGAFTTGEELDRNSLIFFSPDGEVNETVYSKRRLVPFGEFVPWRGFFEAVMPQLVDLLILSGDLEPATDSGVADTDAGRIGSIICFDSIYESLTLDSVRDGAQLLVLSTNDSWFTGSKAVEMHTAQARLRAVETGRDMVRSASTGISMIIDKDGRVLDSTGELESGYSIATVSLRDSKTLYSVIGNLFTYLSIAFVIVMLLSPIYERIINKNDNFEKNKNKF